jgi:hypothetical protein
VDLLASLPRDLEVEVLVFAVTGCEVNPELKKARPYLVESTPSVSLVL